MAYHMFGTVSKLCQQSKLSRATQERRRFEQTRRSTTPDECEVRSRHCQGPNRGPQ